MGHDRGDELASQRRRHVVTLGFGQVALEDGIGRALAEVGFEDRGERESTSRSSPPLPVSLRRHRR